MDKSKIGFNKEAAIVLGAAAIMALNTDKASAQMMQQNNNSRRNNIELVKDKLNKENAARLVQNGQYDAAYKLAFDPQSQGVIRKDHPEDYLEGIRGNVEDMSVDEALKYLNENPDIKAILDAMDKNNDVMAVLGSGKYNSMEDLFNDMHIQVDTVAIDLASHNIFAEFTQGDRAIHLKSFKPDENGEYTEDQKAIINEVIKKLADKDMLGSYLAHELGHKKNDETGLNDFEYTKVKGVEVFDISIEDRDRLNQADEISAEMNSMIYFHEQYQKTGVISDAMRNRFPEYARAIEFGKIDPNSKDPAMQEKEMELIANIAMNDWNTKRKQHYETQVSGYTKDYAEYIVGNRTEESSNGATINPESVPLILNKKMQNCFTFVFNGEAKDFSKHVDLNKIEPYESTKAIAQNFYDKVDTFNKHYHKNYSNPLTYDATNDFVKPDSKER